MRIRRWALPACAAAAFLVFAAQAFAGTWYFTWDGWRGGTRDSRTWHSNNAGTHAWYKDRCRPTAAGLSGGTFTVELRRVRDWLPDISLGTRTFYCNNNPTGHGYASSAGGDHKFRFPYVSWGGQGGITGSGHVTYPL